MITRWCYWCYGNRITSRSKFVIVASGIVTISGTPSAGITTQTVYNYTITTTGSPCNSSVTGTITVDPDDAIALTSAAGTESQVLCETDPLVAIVYEFSEGATSATVSGLPAGVTSTIVGNDLTISGTPSAAISTQTIYSYTVETVGPCTPAILNGTITVNPEGRLDLISAAGTDAQILCENNPIALIEYLLEDGATGATVTGLPAGVSLNVASNVARISGTPIVTITTSTVYSYTITTTGSLCSGSTTGTITIDPADDLSLISAVGTDSQVICEGDSINNIIYQFSGGATSANITGLPPGVSFAITTDLVTISGTPSAVSNPTVYTYTVTTTGPCDSAILSGTITVNPDDELVLTSAVGTDSQVLCEGDAIVNITYQFSGGATNASVTGLPTGVTATILGNDLVIAGTPSAGITTQTVYSYTVTTDGPCTTT